jgi:predicted PolB exonuclease-like 3'-5' exonuclease
MSHVIVWDIETVPDLAGFAAAKGLEGKNDADVRTELGEKFPKHIYHSIICIGALVAHRENEHWEVDALGCPNIGDRTEKELISSFVAKIAELTPQIVTFNGSSFDLPVLRYRAMVNGVSAPGLASRPYFNRYTEDAVDLCDLLSSFSPHTKAGLHELSRVMGLPGKPIGMDGSEVEKYFGEGRIKEIADYCESDVVNTYRVWLRYELFRGRLSDESFQASEANLHEFIRTRGNAKPHLTELIVSPDVLQQSQGTGTIPSEEARTNYSAWSSPMNTYVAHIAGEAVLAFRAEDEEQAQEMVQNHEGLRSDLRVLVDENGKALWDGKSAIDVREATVAQNAEWEQSRDKAISDGEIDLDAGDNPDEWNVYLVTHPPKKKVQ